MPYFETPILGLPLISIWTSYIGVGFGDAGMIYEPVFIPQGEVWKPFEK